MSDDELKAGETPAAAEFKLCYVSPGWAWFTTQDVRKQWGDDWNDAPYEHNAGDPYEWSPGKDVPPYQLARVHFVGMYTPGDNTYRGNSAYSVQDINSGMIAWLSSEDKSVHIFAGTPMSEFSRLVRAGGGTVYVDEAEAQARERKLLDVIAELRQGLMDTLDELDALREGPNYVKRQIN